MGLEPTTTGITIQQQTHDLSCKIKTLHFCRYNELRFSAPVFPYEGKNPL